MNIPHCPYFSHLYDFKWRKNVQSPQKLMVEDLDESNCFLCLSFFFKQFLMEIKMTRQLVMYEIFTLQFLYSIIILFFSSISSSPVLDALIAQRYSFCHNLASLSKALSWNSWRNYAVPFSKNSISQNQRTNKYTWHEWCTYKFTGSFNIL